MIRGFGMSQAAASYSIISDNGNLITDWICRGLKEDMSWVGEHYTCGFVYDDRLIGGVIFHNLRPGHDVWWTIYTTDKRWCNSRVLHFLFATAFDGLGCRRINLLVSKSNQACLRLVKGLGFKIEGCLRDYRENGEDCYILGILKNEAKFYFKNKGEK